MNGVGTLVHSTPKVSLNLNGDKLFLLNCLLIVDFLILKGSLKLTGHRLERDVETGVLTTRHARKAVALQKNGRNGLPSPTDVAVVHCSSTENISNGQIVGRNGNVNLQEFCH